MQFMFIIHLFLLFSLIPYATSFKILSSIDPQQSDTSSSGCPFAELGGTINSLLNTACNTLGDVFFDIVPPLLTHGEELRPEPGFYYVQPNTNGTLPDQRGPCPGLNLLANYGYLPRNGIVTFEQAIEASVRGFNMGTDIATFLAAFAVVTTGNIVTKTFSIGGPDSRVGIGNVGGLARHNTIESDISPNREDLFLGDCDNHHLSSRLFKQNVACAKNQNGLFNLDAMINQYAENAKYSNTKNPYLTYAGGAMIVSVAVHTFYPLLFSNGTYELGGKPDYISISNIVGARLIQNNEDYDFEYVPERWPEVNNTAGKPWYRRGTQYPLIEFLALFPSVYASNPVLTPLGPSRTNLTPQMLGCSLYLTTIQATPAFAAQSNQNTADALAWFMSELDPIFGGTAFGCPASSFSTNGGDNSPYLNLNGANGTSSYSSGSGSCLAKSNQYYNVYFPTAPK